MIPDTALFMFGIQGKQLSAEEIQWLQHPLTAGVILFTRNYDNPAQIRALVRTLRETAGRELLIAVDHEGGRVQRFRNGFTTLPAPATFGQHYDNDTAEALAMAQHAGFIMSYELGDCDIDFSFAPVLDMQTDFSQVIGDRGFHQHADAVSALASAFYQGMRDAGAIGVGKHFPGHGNVVADSHLTLPISDADFATLSARDFPPFKALIDSGIEAMMPAHVLYTAVDGLPAGFSNYWLQTVLRQQLGFQGAIISDDLDMAGAASYGDMTARVALAAQNCDLILLCNRQADMRLAFDTTTPVKKPARQARLTALKRDASRHDGVRYQDYLQQWHTWFDA